MKKKEILTCREGNFFFLSGNAGAHIRSCYCMRDSECRIFLSIFYKTSNYSCFYSFLWFGTD